MNIAVRLQGFNQRFSDAIVSHIRENWSADQVSIERNWQTRRGSDGLLVVGREPVPKSSDVAVSDFVDVPDHMAEASLQDVLLQVDAKLGRLANSYLAKRVSRPSLSGDAKISRRDLLLGTMSGLTTRVDAPVVFEDSCEAKYGCSKCIDVCPSDALKLTDRTISVVENDCTKCGLCAASCPVGAIQMPALSDAAFTGLLEAIDRSPAPKKTLVLTCNREAIKREPGMDVEEIPDVGVVGPRLLAMAAASSLGVVVVHCADGLCVGKDSARGSVEAIKQVVRGGESCILASYLEGVDGEALLKLHQSSVARVPHPQRSGDTWKDYVATLESLSGSESTASGLGLSDITIEETCTLCGSCAKECPHGSLRVEAGRLYFDPSTCTGCMNCVRICPEHSVALTPARRRLTDLLNEGAVYEDEVYRCLGCGAPIGSAKFVGKVSNLLGSANEFVKYCPSCKQRLVIERLTGGSHNG